MKRTVLVFAMMMLLFLNGLNVVIAQEQPQPKKDTVNMDTEAKPTFYYAVEDENADGKGGEKSSSTMILIIVGAVVVVGAAAFFLLKKKK